FVGIFFLYCLVFSGSQVAYGQTPAMPADPVRPVLNLQGPAGYTFALGFAGTPNRIYAAGTGKTVDLWDLERNPDGSIRTAVMAESIRWPVSRGNVGLVNAVALSAQGKWLAVGGSSTFGKNSDLAVFDIAANKLISALPESRLNPDPNGRTDTQAHFSQVSMVIRDLTASPSGVLLASSGSDGQAWLWRGGPNTLIHPQISGTQVQTSQAATAIYWPITFAGPAHVVFASTAAGKGNYRLRYHDVYSGKTDFFNRTVYRRAVTALAATPNGQFVVSADMDGQLVVNAGGRQWSTRIYEVANDDPRVAISDVAITADGQRVAVCGEAADGKSYIRILDTQTLDTLDAVESQSQLSSSENQFRHNAVAFDPPGRQLLVNNNENLTLLVWQLTDQQGNWLHKPLSQTQPFQISGRGSMVRSTAFLANRSRAEQGYAFSINTIANGEQIFDASEGRLGIPEQPKASLPLDDAFADGWKVQHSAPATNHQQKIWLKDGTGRTLERTFDVGFIGRYRGVHAFIPNDAGPPFAVAIAAQRTDLIHVLGLSDGLPILRTFRGHGGEPIGLSCSADGRYLLSTSRDCTVRIWSLERLNGSPVPTDQTIYGASLQVTPAGVVLRNVSRAGIAYARGLREGDVIQKITGTRTKTTPEEIHEFLLNGDPEPFFRELVVDFLRDHKPRQAKFFPAWEQLLTFVFDRTGEWAVFTAEGYFNASRAGQNLFGWQLNRGRNQSVRFEKAAALQKEFEKPDVIRKVLQVGNVPDTLAALNLPPEQNVAARIEELPEIQLSSAASFTPQPPGAQIEIRAKVTFTDALQEDDLELQATNNGRVLPEPVIERANDGSATFTWGLVSADQVHAVSVGYREKNKQVVDSRQSTRQLNFASTTMPQQEPGEMFLIGLSGTEYAAMPDLKYTTHDLDELQRRLKRFQYRRSSNCDAILKEHQITRESVRDAILTTLQTVRERQNSNDLIVFIAAGHGEVYNGEFCYIVPPAAIMGRPLTAQQEAGNYKLSIPWSMIARPLNEAPCHVLWVVDACHSGQAQTESAHKAAIRESAGIHAMRQVLWSSSPREESFENFMWQFESDQSGHGAFSLALLEALTGEVVFPAKWSSELRQFQEKKISGSLKINEQLKAESRYNQARIDAQALRQDRQLDFAEVAGYVTRRVQSLTQDSTPQTPIGFPTRYQPGISSAPSLVLEIFSD
ncbi:MAG: caspase family protein, partial [Planctomycetaceae bacterium]